MSYHEPVKNSAHERSSHDSAVPAVALEMGGGLSLGLAISLNPPISMLLFSLGGLIPLLFSSCEITTHRCFEIVRQFNRASETIDRLAPPMPDLVSQFTSSGPGHYQANSNGEFVRMGLSQFGGTSLRRS